MNTEDNFPIANTKQELDSLIVNYLFDVEYFASMQNQEGIRLALQAENRIKKGLKELSLEDLKDLQKKYEAKNRQMLDEILWRQKKLGKQDLRNEERGHQSLLKILSEINRLIKERESSDGVILVERPRIGIEAETEVDGFTVTTEEVEIIHGITPRPQKKPELSLPPVDPAKEISIAAKDMPPISKEQRRYPDIKPQAAPVKQITTLSEEDLVKERKPKEKKPLKPSRPTASPKKDSARKQSQTKQVHTATEQRDAQRDSTRSSSTTKHITASSAQKDYGDVIFNDEEATVFDPGAKAPQDQRIKEIVTTYLKKIPQVDRERQRQKEETIKQEKFREEWESRRRAEQRKKQKNTPKSSIPQRKAPSPSPKKNKKRSSFFDF
jgi:hypothetical protein